MNSIFQSLTLRQFLIFTTTPPILIISFVTLLKTSRILHIHFLHIENIENKDIFQKNVFFFSFTGTSGTMAWELEKKGVHMVVMWSVPYNLNIYNSYFAVGVVQLTTKFSRDMLPYWYFIDTLLHP